MFGLFNKKRKKSRLEDWQIEPGEQFKKIVLADSVQYVDTKGGRTLYFSILVFMETPDRNNASLSQELSVKEVDKIWQIKGIKVALDHILICVASVQHQDDIEWAKAFLHSLKFNNSVD
ncbi:hypothetical protein HHL16_12920 [Pseudoflavitalea sp. G-6-1-2]|uniref:hypothetical protein n=1 Tax=Pseudoflavitalea sp. G-6-1-2 TaxID=2728841 RepID=UPI00146DF6BA|nr:hypothetical protein [Pseudoflavitalea sp. G-6-1-2]NML21786.1 hypothetical protein [Pseudoflavitalea sp. G-6-1-2]